MNFCPPDTVSGETMCLKLFVALGALMLAGNAALAEATSTSQRQTSEWGSAENGLQCRVTMPMAIEQGMNIPATLELQADLAKIPAGMQKLNVSLHDAFLTLTLTDAGTGKQLQVVPFSDKGSPFQEDFDANLVALKGPLKPWKVHFPLVTVYSNLAPADYVCQVTFSFPTNQPPWVGDRRYVASEPASWWHGTIVSGHVHMQVLRETPRNQIFGFQNGW